MTNPFTFATLCCLLVGCATARRAPVEYPDKCGSHVDCYNLAIHKLDEARATVDNWRPYAAGMIVPFAGPLADAERLQSGGWWICDGRTIDDAESVVRFKNGAKTPNLAGLVLRGVGAIAQGGTLNVVGSDTSTASVPNHDHQTATTMPGGWYPRDFACDQGNPHPPKSCAGIDSNNNLVGQRTSSNGAANVPVATIPHAAEVIYLIYVR